MIIMDLRPREKLDYLALSGARIRGSTARNMPGLHDLSDIGGMDSFTVGDGKFSSATCKDKNLLLKDLEVQLKSLEIQEKMLSLKLAVKDKERRISELDKQVSSSTVQIPHPMLGLSAPPAQATGRASLHDPLARMDLNPRVYLGSPGASAKKYRAIVDFVPRNSRDDSFEEVPIGGGYTLHSSKKNKLDNVTPAQWVAANSRILADILLKDLVGHEAMVNVVLDYLAYTVKIGELAMKHTWASVLVYDDEYRYLQCQHGLPWGSDSPHLVSTNLVKRTKPEQCGQGGYINKEPPTCNYYNEGRHCPHNPCRFRHACKECGKNHPKVEHPGSTTTPASSGAAQRVTQAAL